MENNSLKQGKLVYLRLEEFNRHVRNYVGPVKGHVWVKWFS